MNFKKKIASKKIWVLCAAFLAASGGALLWGAQKDKGNVIFITLDALRADHMSCYGYPRNTTPHMDKLAREGALFTQAISVSSLTISSVPSIMTSTYPDAHRIREFGDLLDPSIISLGGALKENGFFTGAITAQLFPHLLFRGDFLSTKVQLDAKADQMTDWAIEWLERHKNKRFFLWMHYFDPHGPYTPPAPYDTMYLEDKFYKKGEEVPLLDRKRGGFGGIPGYQAQRASKDKNFYIAQYDGEIRFADEQIGRLVKALEAKGLSRKTTIIISADHGESMGEHGYYFDHGASLYDALVRVPLIIYHPAMKPLKRVIHQQVSLVDIMPTILGITKAKPPRQARMEGADLMPLITHGKTYENAYVFGEYFDGEAQQYALRSNEWKLIYEKKLGHYELYDLRKDPGEEKNVFGEDPEHSKMLARQLNAFIERPMEKTDGKRTELSEENQEKLRSLGYLN
ncbi:MAG: sulfatase [Candidatus Omnitrophota bacterium]